MNLAELVSHWQVGTLTDARAAAQGSLNDVTIVTTLGGHFALKTYRSGYSPQQLGAQHEILHDLSADQHPVLTPIPLPDGSSWLESDGRFHVLFPFANGVQFERGQWREIEARAAGQTLAQLHLRLAEYQGALRDKTFEIDLELTLRRLAMLTEHISQKPERDITDRNALDHLEQRRVWLQQHHDSLERRLSELPFQAIHSDYHNGNLFFEDNNVSAVIDWEGVARFPRSWELLRAMHYTLNLEPKLTAAWLAAYRQSNPISNTELEAGVLFYTLERAHALWPFQAYYLQGNERAGKFIDSEDFIPFNDLWARAVDRHINPLEPTGGLSEPRASQIT